MLHDLEGVVPTQSANETSVSDVENEFKPSVGMLVVKTMYYPTGAIKFQELRFYIDTDSNSPSEYLFKPILEIREGYTPMIIRDKVSSGDATSGSKKFQLSTGEYITHELATDYDIEGMVGKLTNEELITLRNYVKGKSFPFSQLNENEGDRLINAIKKVNSNI
jgi:hypothetical protein